MCHPCLNIFTPGETGMTSTKRRKTNNNREKGPSLLLFLYVSSIDKTIAVHGQASSENCSTICSTWICWQIPSANRQKNGKLVSANIMIHRNCFDRLYGNQNRELINIISIFHNPKRSLPLPSSAAGNLNTQFAFLKSSKRLLMKSESDGENEAQLHWIKSQEQWHEKG